jgi:mono/diheme cytochrome c family protein
MLRIFRIQALINVFLLIFVSAPPTWAQTKGNEGKGRYYFRQECKSCHTKAAAGGEVTPLTKTQAQWKSYFLTGKHNKRVEPLTKMLTEEQLRDVQTFLVNHAADSLQPETCGK